MLKRSKIKSIEKMLSLLQCKRRKRRLRHSQKLPEKRQKRRPNLQDNGTQLWPRELSKREKIKKLLN